MAEPSATVRRKAQTTPLHRKQTRFQRDGYQRRFGNRGRESDGGGKRIDPELVASGERCSALAAPTNVD